MRRWIHYYSTNEIGETIINLIKSRRKENYKRLRRSDEVPGTKFKARYSRYVSGDVSAFEWFLNEAKKKHNEKT